MSLGGGDAREREQTDSNLSCLFFSLTTSLLFCFIFRLGLCMSFWRQIWNCRMSRGAATGTAGCGSASGWLREAARRGCSWLPAPLPGRRRCLRFVFLSCFSLALLCSVLQRSQPLPAGRDRCCLAPPAAMELANTRDFQWKTLAPLPSRRVYSTLVEAGGQVFAIGGCDDNGVPMDCFEVYSPEADQWTSLPPMPTARAGVAVATLGKRIMVIGGVGVNQMPLKIVEMYNVDEGKWKKRNSLREAAMGISVTAKGKEGSILPGQGGMPAG